MKLFMWAKFLVVVLSTFVAFQITESQADVGYPIGRVDISSGQFSDLFSSDIQFYPGEDVTFSLKGTVDANHKFWEDRECRLFGLDCKWVRKDASRIVGPDQLPLIITVSSSSGRDEITPPLQSGDSDPGWLQVDARSHLKIEPQRTYRMSFGAVNDEVSAAAFGTGFTLKGKLADKIAQGDALVRSGCPASLCSVGQYTIEIEVNKVCKRLVMMEKLLSTARSASEVTGPTFVDPVFLRSLDSTTINADCPNVNRPHVAKLLIDQADRFHDVANPDYLTILQKAKTIHPENADAANKITGYFLKRGDISGAKETIGDSLKNAQSAFEAAGAAKTGNHYQAYAVALGNASELWLKDRVAMELADLEVSLSFLEKAEEILRQGLESPNLNKDDFQLIRKEYAEKLVDQARILSLIRSDSTLTRASAKLTDARTYFPVTGRGELVQLSGDLRRGLFVEAPEIVARVDNSPGGILKDKEIGPTLIPRGWSSIVDISGDRVLISRSLGSKTLFGLWKPLVTKRWAVPLGDGQPDGTHAALLPSGIVMFSKTGNYLSVIEFSDTGAVRVDQTLELSRVTGADQQKYELSDMELFKATGAASAKETIAIFKSKKGKNPLVVGWARSEDGAKWVVESEALDLKGCAHIATDTNIEVLGSTIDVDKGIVGLSVEFKKNANFVKRALVWAWMDKMRPDNRWRNSCIDVEGRLGQVLFLQQKSQGQVVLLADVGKEMQVFERTGDQGDQLVSKTVKISSVAQAIGLEKEDEKRRLTRVAANEAVLFSQLGSSKIPRGDFIRVLDDKLEFVTAPIGFTLGFDIGMDRVVRNSSGITLITAMVDVIVSVLDLRSGESLFSRPYKSSNLQNLQFVANGKMLAHKSMNSMSIDAPKSLKLIDLGSKNVEVDIPVKCPHRCKVLDSSDDAFWVVKYSAGDSAEVVHRFTVKEGKLSDLPDTTFKIETETNKQGRASRLDILDRMTPSVFPYQDVYVVAPVFDISSQSHNRESQSSNHKDSQSKVKLYLFGATIKEPKTQQFPMKAPEDLVGASFAKTNEGNGVSPVFFFRSEDSFYWSWSEAGTYKIEDSMKGPGGHQSFSYALSRDQKTAVVVAWRVASGGLAGERLALLNLATPKPEFLECNEVGCPSSINKARINDQFLSTLSDSLGRPYDDAPTEFLTMLELHPGQSPTIGVPFSSCLTFFSKKPNDNSKYGRAPNLPTFPYASWIVPQLGAEGSKHKTRTWLASTPSSWDMYTWEDKAPTFSGCAK